MSPLTLVIERLADTYKPEGIDVWLDSPNRNLDGRRPLDLINEGEWQRVLDEADRLAGGPPITEDDSDDWHDRVQHPVWREGCADCVARAEWIEANR